jgi:hypothetical protein
MGAWVAPVTTTPCLKDILDITAAQQAESSLQHQAENSISSPLDISSNQLSHIPNSVFFRVNIYVSLIFFAKYFCGIFFKYTTSCMTMIYATPDALTGHASPTTYPMLGGSGLVQTSGDTTNGSQNEID